MKGARDKSLAPLSLAPLNSISNQTPTCAGKTRRCHDEDIHFVHLRRVLQSLQPASCPQKRQIRLFCGCLTTPLPFGTQAKAPERCRERVFQPPQVQPIPEPSNVPRPNPPLPTREARRGEKVQGKTPRQTERASSWLFIFLCFRPN